MTPREYRALRAWLTEHAPDAVAELDEAHRLILRRTLVADFDTCLEEYAERWDLDADALEAARRDLHGIAARLTGGAA